MESMDHLFREQEMKEQEVAGVLKQRWTARRRRSIICVSR